MLQIQFHQQLGILRLQGHLKDIHRKVLHYHNQMICCLNSKIVAGVQTQWGLVEIGGHDGADSTDKVEYTKDGITWETMPTRLPGLLT